MKKTTTRCAWAVVLLGALSGSAHADAIAAMTTAQHRALIMVASGCGFEPSIDLARHLLARPEMAQYTTQVADHRAPLPTLDSATCQRLAPR